MNGPRWQWQGGFAGCCPGGNDWQVSRKPAASLAGGANCVLRGFHLNRLMAQAGEQAPDFTLPSTVGPLSLSQVWRDRKVVLAFYIEDNTPG